MIQNKQLSYIDSYYDDFVHLSMVTFLVLLVLIVYLAFDYIPKYLLCLDIVMILLAMVLGLMLKLNIFVLSMNFLNCNMLYYSIYVLLDPVFEIEFVTPFLRIYFKIEEHTLFGSDK